MKKTSRWLIGVGVLALGLGCAHEKANVSDQQLARVPPNQLQNVYQQRTQVSRAQDEVARQNLALKEAQNEVAVAKQAVDVAKAESDRAQASLKAAQFARNDAGIQQAQAAIKTAAQHTQVAKAHLDAAQAQVAYAQAQVDAAQKKVDLANAQLALDKYKALAQSGDPAAKDLNEGAFHDRLTKAQKALTDARAQVEQKRLAFVQQRAIWHQQENQLGVGGAGSQGQGSQNQSQGSQNQGSQDQNQGSQSQNQGQKQ